MKTIKIYIMTLLAVMVVSASSCSDSYMSDLNSDPSKSNSLDPNGQLTTASLQTYGDLGTVEIYRNYHYAFAQYLMGCWNTTNYGGRHVMADNEMNRIWTNFYPNAIKNLTDGIYRSDDNPEMVNINSIMRIYRAYMFSLITDVYGDVPCSEAGLGFIEGIYNPKYDSQQDIYHWLFTELKDAAEKLDSSADRITGDVIYSGSVDNWKKFANSLRLRYAMRISFKEPDVARTEFEAALNGPGGVFTSSADDALIKYMDIAFSFGQESYSDYRGNALSKLFFGNDPANNPSYLCSTFFKDYLLDKGDPRTFMFGRFYYDGLMSATSPTNRIDLTEEVIGKGVDMMHPCVPGGYSWEPWPQGYESDIMKEVAKTHPGVETTMARETEPKLANNFLKSDNPGVVMTYAEVKFLMAEAALNGWAVTGDVESNYKEGVREAMNFLTNNYGCDRVSDEAFEEFIAKNGVGYTHDQKLANINIQAWILHFHNPAEGWANVRRSGYPALKSPAMYVSASFIIEGKEIPKRLLYPQLEASYNLDSYQAAIANTIATSGRDKYDWHCPVWWDIHKSQENANE